MTTQYDISDFGYNVSMFRDFMAIEHYTGLSLTLSPTATIEQIVCMHSDYNEINTMSDMLVNLMNVEGVDTVGDITPQQFIDYGIYHYSFNTWS